VKRDFDPVKKKEKKIPDKGFPNPPQTDKNPGSMRKKKQNCHRPFEAVYNGFATDKSQRKAGDRFKRKVFAQNSGLAGGIDRTTRARSHFGDV